MSIFPFFSVIVNVKVRLHVRHLLIYDLLTHQTVTEKLQTPGTEQTPGKEPRRHGDHPRGFAETGNGTPVVRIVTGVGKEAGRRLRSA